MSSTSTFQHVPRAIWTLNAVSALAQLGQYGIGFILLPIAMQALGQSAVSIGFASSAAWAGMLLGLLTAPRFCRALPYRAVVLAGLSVSAIALATTPQLPPSQWWCTALLIGYGTGLRWIANETWLYVGIPSKGRASIVGLHETLIGIASFIGPAVVSVLDVTGPWAFRAGTAACLAAALPLLGTTSATGNGRDTQPEPESADRLPVAVLILPLATAALGGLLEASWSGLFPVYAGELGWRSPQIAQQLFFYGLGSMLLQFPIGWMAGRYGSSRAIQVCAVTAIAALAALIGWHSFVGTAIAMFLLGGAIAGFLTIAIYAMTDAATHAWMARAISLVSTSFTVTSAIGPGALALFVEPLGAITIPAAACAICVALWLLASAR